MNLETYAQDLESYRQRHNLTQAALAEKLGVSRPALTHWLLGDTVPKFNALLKIDKLLREEEKNT